MSAIQQQYEARMAELTPAERMARSAAMLKWTRDLIARQVLAKEGAECDRERVKWLVARRLYDSDPRVKAMIEGVLESVSARGL